MIRKSPHRLWLCGLLTAVMLAFIWGNSLLPGQASGQLSGRLGRLLQYMLPVFSPDRPEGQLLLRKCAHFTEFALLGGLLCWLWAMLSRQPGRILLLAMGTGAAAAAIDETIQRFVPQRHGCLADVLLDCCGVAVGSLLLLLCLRRCSCRHSTK